jgi:hypothetical protein
LSPTARRSWPAAHSTQHHSMRIQVGVRQSLHGCKLLVTVASHTCACKASPSKAKSPPQHACARGGTCTKQAG